MAQSAGILVRYFAAAAEAAGVDEETLHVQPQTVEALRYQLISRYGEAMERVLATGSLLVDGVATRDGSRPVQRQVDVLPPFAGG